MQLYGPFRVGRVIDVDLPLQVVALARGFDFQPLIGGISRAVELHEERIVESLRRYVFDGDGAVKAVPRADKIHIDGFGHVQCGIRLNENFRGKFLDFQLPCGSRGRQHQRK